VRGDEAGVLAAFVLLFDVRVQRLKQPVDLREQVAVVEGQRDEKDRKGDVLPPLDMNARWLDAVSMVNSSESPVIARSIATRQSMQNQRRQEGWIATSRPVGTRDDESSLFEG